MVERVGVLLKFLQAFGLIVKPLADLVGHAFLSVRFERVKEKDARKIMIGGLLFVCSILIHDVTGINNNAKRPMQALINRNEYKCLLEDVNILFGCP